MPHFLYKFPFSASDYHSMVCCTTLIQVRECFHDRKKKFSLKQSISIHVDDSECAKEKRDFCTGDFKSAKKVILSCGHWTIKLLLSGALKSDDSFLFYSFTEAAAVIQRISSALCWGFFFSFIYLLVLYFLPLAKVNDYII